VDDVIYQQVLKELFINQDRIADFIWMHCEEITHGCFNKWWDIIVPREIWKLYNEICIEKMENIL
jgi:hypothetical protein